MGVTSGQSLDSWGNNLPHVVMSESTSALLDSLPVSIPETHRVRLGNTFWLVYSLATLLPRPHPNTVEMWVNNAEILSLLVLLMKVCISEMLASILETQFLRVMSEGTLESTSEKLENNLEMQSRRLLENMKDLLESRMEMSVSSSGLLENSLDSLVNMTAKSVNSLGLSENRMETSESSLGLLESMMAMLVSSLDLSESRMETWANTPGMRQYTCQDSEESMSAM